MCALHGRETAAHSRLSALLAVLLLSLSLFTACAVKAPQAEAPAAITITSSAFPDRGNIPSKYTCDGANVSPPLAWGEPPPKTQSFALICDDPDAPIGVFTHWVIFNIPSGARGLEEAVPAEGRLANGALQGRNGFGKIGYGGPCPPKGPAHRYVFTIYALDASLDLDPGASKKDLLKAMEGHIIAQGQLIGTYQR